MKIESEKLLERKLVKEMKALGGLCLKLPALHHTGLPDRMCLIPGGRMFFAEIKTTKAKPRKIQLLVHDQLRKLGFRVEVVDTTEQIKKLISEYA